MSEEERQRLCADVANRIYSATGQWMLDEILKLTAPEIEFAWRSIPFKLPEPTPVDRGVLDRYQDRKRRR